MPEQKEITTKRTKLHILGLKGITSKPAFRQSIRSKRCLVLADAFIEGPKVERLSKPYVIYKRMEVRLLADIYDTWINPDTGGNH